MTKVFLLLAAIIGVSLNLRAAAVIDELQEGQWETIGEGTLIDGWVIGRKFPDKYEKDEKYHLKVTIQKHKDSNTLFRVWQPYKNLTQVTGIQNKSVYQGQIVFDIRKPDNVLVSFGMPAGYYVEESFFPYPQPGMIIYPNEMYILNEWGYYSPQGMPESYFKSNRPDAISTFDDKTVTIPHSPHISEEQQYLDFRTDGPTSYIIFPDDYEFEQEDTYAWEYEEGQWDVIGKAIFEDGWVTNGVFFEAELHRNKANPNIYRLWEPYKDLEAKTALDPKSKYHGQIVFDTSDPEYVRIVYGKPMGFFSDRLGAEAYAVNQFGYVYAYYDLDSMDPSERESDLNWIKGNLATNPDYSTKLEDGVITVANAKMTSEGYPNITSTYSVSRIYLNLDKDQVFDPFDNEKYLWRDIISYPDNKYFITTYDAQKDEPLTESGARVPYPALGSYGNYEAQIIKNYEEEDNQKVLRIYFTQFRKHDPYQADNDWRPYYVISKNSNDYCYEVDFSNLNLPAETYEIVPQSGIKYNLLPNPTPIVSNSGNEWLRRNHFTFDGDKTMWDLVITIYFDKNDENYDNPKAVKFDYKDEAPAEKAFFIGTLAKTSELYDETKDKLEGYQTRVPLDGEDYPYIYNFVAEDTEYEFILFNRFPYYVNNGLEFYQTYVRAYDYDNYQFHNELAVDAPLEPLTDRIPKQLSLGQIFNYPGYSGFPHKDREVLNYFAGVFDNKTNYTPFRISDLTPGKLYQIKIDHPNLAYQSTPTHEWVENVDLDKYFQNVGLDISNLKEYYAQFGVTVLNEGDEPVVDESRLTYNLKFNPRDLTPEEVAKVTTVPTVKRLERNARYQVTKGVYNQLNNAHINMVVSEYTPELETYQLVQSVSYDEKTGKIIPNLDESGNKVYYTYDYTKERNKTYKVAIDSNGKVTACNQVYSIDNKIIDESTLYKSQNYLFTDWIILFSSHPEWFKADVVNNKITGIKGKLTYNKNENEVITAEFNTSETFDPEHIYEVIKMKGLEKPLLAKDFAIDYSYKYSNKYVVAHRSMYNLDLPNHYDLHYLIMNDADVYYTGELEEDLIESTNEKPVYKLKAFHHSDRITNEELEKLQSNMPKNWAGKDFISEADVFVGDNENLKNPQVETTGILVVPTPAPESERSHYDFSVTRDAEGAVSADPDEEENKAQTVKIRLYDNDYAEYREKDKDYWEVEYVLPETRKVHAHDYHIIFPYVSPNVTSDFGDVVNDGTDAKPYPQFRFTADGKDYSPVVIDANNNDAPGFFNADLGDIYDVVVNQGESAAIRSLSLDWGTFPSTQLYDRWGDGMTAKVNLDLTAPNLDSKKVGMTGTTDLWRDIRLVPQTSDKYVEGKELWEETIYMPGASLIVTNTDDFVEDNADSKLRERMLTGDDATKDHTTLYVVEFLNEHDKTPVIMSREELANTRLVLAISDESFEFDKWPGWSGAAGATNGDALIKIGSLGKTRELLKVRNVYLFPVENEGLLTAGQASFPEPDNASEVRRKVNAVAESGYKPSYTYYGVTTPVQTLAVDIDEPLTTGVDNVTVSTDSLAKAHHGAIEILVDGATLYNAEGTMLGTGRGVVNVAAGMYLVHKDNLVQKLVVQ